MGREAGDDHFKWIRSATFVSPTRVLSQRAIFKLLFGGAVGVAIYLRVHTVMLPFLWLAIAVAVVLRGRWEERVVAMALAVTLATLSAAPRYHGFAHLYDVEGARAGVFSVGFVFMAVLLVVALRSRWVWPSWVAAFQLLILVTHLVFVARRGAIEPWAYISSVVIWTWLEIVALSFGVADAWVDGDLDRPPGFWIGGLQLLIVLTPLPLFATPPTGLDASLYRSAVAISAVIAVLAWIWIAAQGRRGARRSSHEGAT